MAGATVLPVGGATNGWGQAAQVSEETKHGTENIEMLSFMDRGLKNEVNIFWPFLSLSPTFWYIIYLLVIIK